LPELVATVYNINDGRNLEILSRSFDPRAAAREWGRIELGGLTVDDILKSLETIDWDAIALDRISADPDIRARARSRMKFLTDLNTTIGIREDRAFAQGFLQGFEEMRKKAFMKWHEEEGREQALMKWREKGREQVRIDAAIKLTKRGLSLNAIAEYIDVTAEEIERIRAQLT
jgi:hypothetical protein